jgi:hypothetical protein
MSKLDNRKPEMVVAFPVTVQICLPQTPCRPLHSTQKYPSLYVCNVSHCTQPSASLDDPPLKRLWIRDLLNCPIVDRLRLPYPG